MVPFEENFDWAHQRKWEKYEDLQEHCVRSGWTTNIFLIEVRCWGFILNSTLMFLTNLGLSPSDKSKYIKKFKIKLELHQHGYGNPTEWHQSNKAWWYCDLLQGYSWLVVMMLQPWNHAWTQSHHLMKALLEAMLLYKH